jgi:hypothetical protein
MKKRNKNIKNSKTMPESPLGELEKKMPTTIRDLGLSYKKAFVTFIDVLGFSRMVMQKSFEEINIILNKMDFFSRQPQLRRPSYSLDKHLPMVFQFSDSIIRIQPVDEDDDNVDILDFFQGEIESLLLAQGNLVCNGVLVRGGLTYGEVCVHQDRIFGRAFLKAHSIESTLAQYPRILIDENLLINNKDNPLKDSDLYDCIYETMEYLERADDGHWFINYLPHLCEAIRDPNISKVDVLKAHRNQLQKLLEGELPKKTPEILSKIRWAASYHNRIVSKYYPKELALSDDKRDTLLIFF